MDEWSQRQFIQENLEETALGTERRWQSATGRWANLQWEPSDLTPMQELFDEQQGALPELPLLAHLTGWEQGLLRRYWWEQLQDRPEGTPNLVYLNLLDPEQVKNLEEFLEQALFLIQQVQLDQEEKEWVARLY